MTSDETLKRLMYGQDSEVKKKDRLPKNLKINETAKVVVIENGGVRYQVPSTRLVEELARENSKLKSDLLQMKTEVKKLVEVISKMDNAIRAVEVELANKVDIYGED